MTGWNAELERYFEAKAPTYDAVGEDPYWRLSDALLWNFIEAEIDALGVENAHFLDAGGGTGRWSARVMERLPRSRGVLLDASNAMLTVARERFQARTLSERIRVELVDLDETDVSRFGSFDLVLCFHNVLGFVADPYRVVEGLRTSLSASGVALLVIPNTLHAVFYSLLRGRVDEAQRAWSQDEVRFSSGPPMRTFDDEVVLRDFGANGFLVDVRGFPVTIYPSPSSTFARASEPVAAMLEDEANFASVLKMEKTLSGRPHLAPRGNNLLVTIRRGQNR